MKRFVGANKANSMTGNIDSRGVRRLRSFPRGDCDFLKVIVVDFGKKIII